MFGFYSMDGCTYTVSTVCFNEEISRFQLIQWLKKVLTLWQLGNKIQIKTMYNRLIMCRPICNKLNACKCVFCFNPKETFRATQHILLLHSTSLVMTLWAKWIKRIITQSKHCTKFVFSCNTKIFFHLLWQIEKLICQIQILRHIKFTFFLDGVKEFYGIRNKTQVQLHIMVCWLKCCGHRVSCGSMVSAWAHVQPGLCCMSVHSTFC